MKKFVSIWSIIAVLSTAVAIDFYIAIHENANLTIEQIGVCCFFIVFFVIFALVSVGAHIENIIYKNK